MKKKHLLLLLIPAVTLFGCQQEEFEDESIEQLSPAILEGMNTPKGVETVINLFGSPAHVLDIGSHYLFQGDIWIDKNNYELEKETRGAAVLNRVWHNNTVYYTIHKSLTPTKYRVEEAIDYLKRNTYILFIPRTTESNYIEIVDSDSTPETKGVTYSDYIGMKTGRQVIGLSGWATRGSVIHEFCHALGLFHEQTRQDRDNYVKVNFDLMTSDSQKYQYRKYTESGYTGFDYKTFDFNSIMLYPSIQASNGAYLMTKLDGSPFSGQRDSLSINDKGILTELYKPYVGFSNEVIERPDPSVANLSSYVISQKSAKVTFDIYSKYTTGNEELRPMAYVRIQIGNTEYFMIDGETLMKSVTLDIPQGKTNISISCVLPMEAVIDGEIPQSPKKGNIKTSIKITNINDPSMSIARQTIGLGVGT